MPKKTREAEPFWKSLAAHPLWVALVGAVAVGIVGVVTWTIEQPRPSIDQILTTIPRWSHSYSFTMAGRRISGRSRSPFERATGYYARVEGCQRFGIEGVSNLVSCYLTIRPSANLVISNSENLTTAFYSDGSAASICCLYTDDIEGAPLYRIRMPPGLIERRTYPRGSEFHIVLNVPNADPTRTIDAIWFSPGEGVRPVLFPIRDRIEDGVYLTSAFINAHKDDPRLQALIRRQIAAQARLRAQEAANKGITYPP